MSYQNEPLKKAQYTGSDMIPLSCEKELISIREDIENGVNHTGKNFEICYQAVKEIYESQGMNTPNASCSNCTVAWNHLLKNWFIKLDMDIRPKEATSKTEPKPLTAQEGADLLESGEKESVIVDGEEYTKEDLNNTWKEIEPEYTLQELRDMCEDEGIDWHPRAKEASLKKKLGL